MNQYLAVAFEAALLGGVEILDIYDGADFQVESKSDNSPLTIADRRSHQVINKTLSKAFPDIPILSEKGEKDGFENRKNWHQYWLVDPLDGTKDFIKRNDEFTVNIALIRDNRPVLGVVHVPVADVLYYAYVNGGAYRVDDALYTTFGPGVGSILPQPEKLREEQQNVVRVVASRSHFTGDTAEYVRQLEQTFGSISLIHAGSAQKICLVAEGSAEVYPRFGPTMEWDLGAAYIVALEAGCTVVEATQGGPLFFNKENLLNPGFIVRSGSFCKRENDGI